MFKIQSKNFADFCSRQINEIFIFDGYLNVLKIVGVYVDKLLNFTFIKILKLLIHAKFSYGNLEYLLHLPVLVIKVMTLFISGRIILIT